MEKKTPSSDACRPTNDLFGRVVASPFNVHLEICGHEFLVYAGGYKRAGDTVVQNLRGAKQELMFPVCYLYRHYLELMIKGLTRLAKLILNEDAVYSTHHKLVNLWQECRPLLEKAIPSYSKAGFNDVGKYIEAFASFNFDGEFSRYPEDKFGVPWPQPVEYINLQKMHDAVSDAAELFDSYYLEINSILEHRAETDAYVEGPG